MFQQSVMLFLLSQILLQLAGIYGDVYSLRSGSGWLVVVNGFEVMREALLDHGDSISDRPIFPFVQERSYGGRGERQYIQLFL